MINGIVFYVSFALILWSIFGRRIGLTALAVDAVIAVGVGVSRIYLGYHYLTDVAGGSWRGSSGCSWWALPSAHGRPGGAGDLRPRPVPLGTTAPAR